MEEKEIHDELASIRILMERSSKFISLSGLSGILAGVYALVGAGAAYEVLINDPFNNSIHRISRIKVEGLPATGLFYGEVGGGVDSRLIIKLTVIALAVFVASIVTAAVLSNRQAQRKEQPIWGSLSRSLLFHMSVPLISGGLLIAILIIRGHYGIVGASSLIFYGLALVSASNYTFTDVKYLGLCEIALGLIAACLPGYGLLFWAIGFGVLHIIYGGMMYLKYDK